MLTTSLSFSYLCESCTSEYRHLGAGFRGMSAFSPLGAVEPLLAHLLVGSQV